MRWHVVIKVSFRPRNPKKYVGDSSNIVCRSNWGENISVITVIQMTILLHGSSEEFSIPYISPIDNRRHRYYPDFLIKVKESNGKLKKYVIEIKPKKQTIEPKRRSRVTKTYITEMKIMLLIRQSGSMLENFVKIIV